MTLKSLTDILDAEIADKYVVDSSIVGLYFLVNGRGLPLNKSNARRGNFTKLEVKNAIKNSEAFTEFMTKYSNVCTVQTVIEELAIKERMMRAFVGSYGVNYYFGIPVSYKPTSYEKKMFRKIERLKQSESAIFESLKKRVLTADGRTSLNRYKSLVLVASSNYFKGEVKNRHDEDIVASSMHYAHSTGERVAIITGDRRFVYIVENVQKHLRSSGELPDLQKLLHQDKISIVEKREEGFEVAYCSEDFYREPKNRVPIKTFT